MAIQIKPVIQHQSVCPYTQAPLVPKQIIWQGMHVCVESECVGCNKNIIEDLKVGHALRYPFQIDVANNQAFGPEEANAWLGTPFLASLKHPIDEHIEITKEVFSSHRRVVILNCLDYLYGHCLLKLLNADRHFSENSQHGLVVIVPKFLRWMVPSAAAEVWTVNISLQNNQQFYSKFHAFVCEELARFDEVLVSEAYSHPSNFDISDYTKVAKHDFYKPDYRVTFIWREDRLWIPHWLFRVLRKSRLTTIALSLQNQNIQKLLKLVKAKIPEVKVTVAGFGTQTKFPAWIEDVRVDTFDAETERRLCKIYADSRVVIGIHGSSMLLPSGHAGMSVDLLPQKRLGNFAQDILYQEADPRVATFRYRYLLADIEPSELSSVVTSMLKKYSDFCSQMCADK